MRALKVGIIVVWCELRVRVFFGRGIQRRGDLQLTNGTTMRATMYRAALTLRPPRQVGVTGSAACVGYVSGAKLNFGQSGHHLSLTPSTSEQFLKHYCSINSIKHTIVVSFARRRTCMIH